MIEFASNGEKNVPSQETKYSQLQTLQKSANDSTTCSSNTMKGMKNVTSSAASAQVPMANTNTNYQYDPNLKSHSLRKVLNNEQATAQVQQDLKA